MSLAHLNCHLNYKFQEKDERDHTCKTEAHPELSHLEVTTITRKGTVTTKTQKVAPASYNVTSLPPIIDQGDLGTCVANAFSYCVSKQTNKAVNLSRLFLYAICRCLDYTSLDMDDGTTIRTACQSIKGYGVCKESVYPYITSKYTDLPPLTVFTSSKLFQKFTYTFVNQDLTTFKNCLYNNNTPIVFGFLVYSSFMSLTVSNTGIVPNPNIATETLEGGHCMCIVGYNDTTQQFKCANSWGTSWGERGYCYLPYAYILNPNLASDFCFTQFVY
jgi:C1A family cysteine protease